MSSLNMYAKPARKPAMSQVFATNYGGALVPKQTSERNLVRMTLANMLWENQFYIDGKSATDILKQEVANSDPKVVAEVAKRARKEFKLRHVPLLLLRELARKSALNGADLAEVIQRPDEMGEFLSLYWQEGRKPLANQVKKGLGTALGKFNEYTLAKWDKNSANISVRDVMFLTHPKPANPEQAALFAKIAAGKLETPNTWETRLSGGEDKREVFVDLMETKSLGALAFLRNLRNMVQAGVPVSLIEAYGDAVNVDKVLPFRYVAAARIVPQFKSMLERMMLRSLSGMTKLSGTTALLVDVSGSMFGVPVSAKSDLDRADAAVALAMLAKNLCQHVDVYSFSNQLAYVTSNKKGFGLADDILNSQRHGGTDLARSLEQLAHNSIKYDRIIVITDEQAHRAIGSPTVGTKGYIINVGSYQNGISNGSWHTITGFSEAVFDYLKALEAV